MVLSVGDMERMVRAALPDAVVEVSDLGGGSHYAARVVSAAFRGMTRIQRHRMVYDAIGEDVGRAVHALTLETSAPEEVCK